MIRPAALRHSVVKEPANLERYALGAAPFLAFRNAIHLPTVITSSFFGGKAAAHALIRSPGVTIWREKE